ncbi:type III restriction protein res subunit [Alicyclobacillus hesperidum URH17-3-68]|nr:DEAD/DEAH box helicase family protein [Alicyclobacillus hesperidum]EJY54743.1 type III restriction protein res subunit [Alicyclobacillus hesperidum URH17-3-68]
MAIQLRPYQQTAVDAFFQALADGRKRQLVVLPTGAGKTIVFGSVARQADSRHRALHGTTRPSGAKNPLCVAGGVHWAYPGCAQ